MSTNIGEKDYVAAEAAAVDAEAAEDAATAARWATNAAESAAGSVFQDYSEPGADKDVLCYAHGAAEAAVTAAKAAQAAPTDPQLANEAAEAERAAVKASQKAFKGRPHPVKIARLPEKEDTQG